MFSGNGFAVIMAEKNYTYRKVSAEYIIKCYVVQ